MRCPIFKQRAMRAMAGKHGVMVARMNQCPNRQPIRRLLVIGKQNPARRLI
jgi:hypothetical protein